MSFINYTQLDDKFQTPCKHFNDHKPSNEKKVSLTASSWEYYILSKTHAEFVDFFNKVWLNKLSREPRNVGEKLKQAGGGKYETDQQRKKYIRKPGAH